MLGIQKRLLARLTSDERKRKSAALLCRHGLDDSLDEVLQNDATLVKVLEKVTPWLGDDDSDTYDDMAYLHGHACVRFCEILDEERPLGILHELLTNSIEDWMDLANNGDRMALSALLIDMNGRLLKHWQVGSRALVSLLLLLNPSRELLTEALLGWPDGRFGPRDILRSCDQAEAINWDPIDVLCWDSAVIKNVDADDRPVWYDLEDDAPAFAEPMSLGQEEIHKRLDGRVRQTLLAAIRAAIS